MKARRRGPTLRAAAAAALAAVVPGCYGEGGVLVPFGETAPTVRVELTDLPSELLASAEVWISRVYLVGGPGGQVDLFRDEEDPHRVDLLELRDGERVDLTGDVEASEGVYDQLRIVVDSAVVTLAAERTFLDGSTSRTVLVPPAEAEGIRVRLRRADGTVPAAGEAGALPLEEGTTTVVVVDFDVDRSFFLQGSEEDGFEGVTFTPVLEELAREVEGT